MKDMSFRAAGLKADKWAGWAAAALGFSIPVSTAGDNILLAVILALFLIGGRFRERIGAVRDNPIVLPALALLGMYVVGLTYGEAPWSDAVDSLKKAANFLLIPILLALFRDEKVRRWAIEGFLAVMALTLLISYLLWAGAIPANELFNGTRGEPYVFKNRLTHSFLMAFGAYLFALKARVNENRPKRILLASLAVAALHNVLFLVASRTGYVVALVLGACFLFSVWRWRGAAVAAALILLLSGAVYLLPASAPHQRLKLMVEEATQWQPGQPENTSVGYRLEFYRNSLELIRKRPLIGSGTGGFRGGYAALVRGTGMQASDNPHNEYLMVAVQLGVVGLALLLWLFLAQWRKAASLPGGFERPATRGLVLLIVSASLVTSTLIDHTEGLFYVWISALLFAGWSAAGDHEPCRCPSL